MSVPKKWRLEFRFWNRRRRSSAQSATSVSDIDGAVKKINPTVGDYLWLDTRARVCYVVTLCLLVGIVCPLLINWSSFQVDLGRCEANDLYKFQCLSGSRDNVSETSCLEAGCCWNAESRLKCFHATPSRYSFLVERIEETSDTITVKLKSPRNALQPFGLDLAAAKVVLKVVQRDHLVFQLLQADDAVDGYRNQAPSVVPASLAESDFNVSLSSVGQTFSVRVVRRSSDPANPDVLLDTSRGPLTLTGGYVEVSTVLPSVHVFGLGPDRRTSLARNLGLYPKLALYNRVNYDGYHPFYMVVGASGLTHGAYWDNTHPLEVQLTPDPAISFRSSGGRGILHVFSGPTPAAVSRQYGGAIVGAARLPPFWALGLHLCRESRNGSASLFARTLNLMQANVVAFDSDCIDLRLPGPFSGVADVGLFPEAASQRRQLAAAGKKFVLAQPPHVQITDDGNNSTSTLIRNATGPVAGVRLGTSVFYPSFDGAAPSFDADAMLEPDGVLFIDNQPSNDEAAVCADLTLGFVPEKLGTVANLSAGTICSDAVHPGGRLQIQVHNIYGVEQVRAFDQQRRDTSTRPFYLNRASALGNFGLAGSLGEDLAANWLYMKMALVQVLDMGLFGVALSGAPICGSTNGTSALDNLASLDDEQLCVRWYQMGLLMPLAHSLSRLDQRPRAPVDWSAGGRKIVANAIQLRYRLLAHFYTLLYQASTEGVPAVRPLFYEFPDDNATLTIGDQFLVGDAILVCPVLDQDSSDQRAAAHSCYLPAASWYDYHTGQSYPVSANRTTLVTPLAHVDMFVRNGTIFATQEAPDDVLSAESIRQHPYTLTAALPVGRSAVGHLYIDDGSTGDVDAFDYVRFELSAAAGLTATALHRSPAGVGVGVSTTVDAVRLFGARHWNASVCANCAGCRSAYDRETDVLHVTALNFDLAQLVVDETRTLCDKWTP